MTSTEFDPRNVTIDELGAAADARWNELDRTRRLPQDLHGVVAAAGLFRQLVAPALGGDGRPPLEWFRTGMALARHEASTAWVVTQGAAELGWIAAGADPAWAAEVLADPRARRRRRGRPAAGRPDRRSPRRPRRRPGLRAERHCVAEARRHARSLPASILV